jgi:sulfite exporter TauE/SafE
MQRERGPAPALATVLLLSVGRFISYALFGALAGYAGHLASSRFHTQGLVLASYLALTAYLVYTAFVQTEAERGHCVAPKHSRLSGNPLVIGAITGLSVCPSFLLALTRGFELGGPLGGVLLFIGFFAGTTIFLLPFVFFSFFSRMRLFRVIGIAATVLVALWFLLRSAAIIRMMAAGRPV